MPEKTRIAIDCMGGDYGLRISLPAARNALEQHPDLELVLVGDQQQIQSELAGFPSDRVDIQHASEVISMSEAPVSALRKKTDSSMRVAVDLLQQGRVDAVVSAGNTGALMAIGCYVLKTLPGIDRPAICSALPSVNGCFYLLDLGANVDSTADNLYQFAMMGAALVAAVDGNSAARVALLNIGHEEIKGNEQVKLAAQQLEADPGLNYVGFVEGDALFDGGADVVVCDGFVGNIALKVCEGTASRIADILQNQFRRNLLSRLAGLLAMPVLRRVYHIVDPEQYNGASFLGLQGILVKSHGDSSIESFSRAISRARSEVRGEMLTLIAQRLSAMQRGGAD